MLPGESRTLVLKEGRFIELVEEVTSEETYQNVMGIAVMGEDHLMSVVSLCEVTSYSLDAGFRGKVTATVTLHCVGRAKLDELQQVKPIMEGRCHELVDSSSPVGSADDDNQLVACQQVAKDIESLLEGAYFSSSQYQKAFWNSLTALGYQPTVLLTRDPSATNTRKELEASSWATLSMLSTETSLRYQGLQTTDLLERLQLGRSGLLQEQMLSSPTRNTTCDSAFDDSGFE